MGSRQSHSIVSFLLLHFGIDYSVPAFFDDATKIPEEYTIGANSKYPIVLELRKEYSGMIFDTWDPDYGKEDRVEAPELWDITPKKPRETKSEWPRRWVITLLPNLPDITETLPHGFGKLVPILSSESYWKQLLQSSAWLERARHLLSKKFYQEILSPRLANFLSYLDTGGINPFIALTTPNGAEDHNDLYYALSRRFEEMRADFKVRFGKIGFMGVTIPPARVEVISNAAHAKRRYEDRKEQTFLLIVNKTNIQLTRALGWGELLPILNSSYWPSIQEISP